MVWIAPNRASAIQERMTPFNTFILSSSKKPVLLYLLTSLISKLPTSMKIIFPKICTGNQRRGIFPKGTTLDVLFFKNGINQRTLYSNPSAEKKIVPHKITLMEIRDEICVLVILVLFASKVSEINYYDNYLSFYFNFIFETGLAITSACHNVHGIYFAGFEGQDFLISGQLPWCVVIVAGSCRVNPEKILKKKCVGNWFPTANCPKSSADKGMRGTYFEHYCIPTVNEIVASLPF